MKRILIITIALFALCSCSVKQTADEAEIRYIGYALSNLSVVNHHEQPDVDEEIGCQTLMGTVLRIIEESDNWLKVETPAGYRAWVSSEAVSVKDSSQVAEWGADGNLWIVTKSYSVLRSEPSDDAEIICDITLGDLFAKGEELAGSYNKCILPDGREAYVPKEDIEDFDSYLDCVELTGKSLTETAKQFLGIPYVWGWNCIKGMDCSGLTQFVYYLHGLIIPRNASQQALIGEPVDISNGVENLEAGDLLFFCNSTPGKVNHVGMYIGDGEFIHSGTSCIKINSLIPSAENLYFNADKLFCAKRILGSDDCLFLKNSYICAR